MRTKFVIGFCVVAISAIAIVASIHGGRVVRTNLLGFKADESLDPTTLRFVQQYFPLDNLTGKLVELGPSGEYINSLAKEIKFSEQGKTIDITLNEASFSDGTPINATDVARSFKRSTIIGTPHANLNGLWVGSENLKSVDSEIEGIRVIDEKHLKLKLTRPSKEILFYLSMTDMAILSPGQYRKEKLTAFDWTKATSGPFHVEYNDKGTMTLVANPNAINATPKMPKSITFESYKGDDVIKRLENKSLEFGSITLADYLNHSEKIERVKGLDVIGNKTDGIVYVNLNPRSKIFKNPETRRWVQRKILEAYEVDPKYRVAISKATQFFLPNAKGYIPNAKVRDLLLDVDTSRVPDELQSGFTITTLKGMKDYLPEDIEATLSKVLGVKVVVNKVIAGKDWQDFLGRREFDASMTGVSMSYKVLGEILNLQYLSKAPAFVDPTGKIHSLLTKYQRKANDESEQGVIEDILAQMVKDSECVPLYYFASPFFANPGRIDVSKLNLDESVQFWRAQVL